MKTNRPPRGATADAEEMRAVDVDVGHDMGWGRKEAEGSACAQDAYAAG